MGDTAAVIQRRTEEREQKGREEEAQKQREERQKVKAMREETAPSVEEGVARKRERTDGNDTEMDTEGREEAGTSQTHSRHKKGHMTNIYLTDSGKEAIVDFVSDHEELYDKTREHSNAPFTLQAIILHLEDFLGGGTAPQVATFHPSCSIYTRTATDWTWFFNHQ